jgi:serine/threonine-protein kinase
MAKVFTITEGLENMGALRTGGQGSVYKARRTGTMLTAVKILPTPIHSETQDDKHFIAFQNEVNKLKKVNEQPNPNVVKILSSGITESGSFPFIEMEFIEGPDLEDLLKPPHEPVFTVKEAIKLADQLANALAHCHKVGVKHGDIKSNNVKLNAYSGNYVLLDFGLALMSDEQRRTSLRHAGAIEFMAPEQNEGQMLFQTDVYSFGVILFELLAGIVPFPLKDKGETARNNVMVAHMETPPPDLISLRRQNLPETWSEEKIEREMQVPEWLIQIVYRCLQKKPSQRFNDGMQLHEHLVVNSTVSANKIESAGNQLYNLQQENQKLLREKQQLQQQLNKYEMQSLRMNNDDRASYPAHQLSQKKGIPKWIYFLLVLIGLSAIVYALVVNTSKPEPVAENNNTVIPEKPLRTIGQYKVLTSRAFFHNEPGHYII